MIRDALDSVSILIALCRRVCPPPDRRIV